jgi:predicted dehydrogenase
MKEVRVGLIGYGGAFNMGLHHGRGIEAVEGMRVTAACDLDARRMKAAAEDFPGIETYTDLGKLAKSPNVDLGVIILPHNVHASAALACLKAGQHVILEKPMCITAAEAQKMIAAARAQDLMLTVFHNRRHDGDFLALKRAVEGGLVGDVFSVEMWMGGYHEPRDWWRSDKKVSGGAFYDWGAHYLDWLLQIIKQDVVNVTGFFHKRVWHRWTNEDHVQAVIRFADGVVADVQQSSIAFHDKPRWRVLGTKGALVSQHGGFRYHTIKDGVRVEGFVPDAEGTHHLYYQNIADHLLRGKDLDVKSEQAARVIAIMEAAEKSSKSGKAEKIPEF